MIDKEILDAVIPVPTLEEAKDEKVAELKEEGFVVTNFHSGGVFYTLLMVELRTMRPTPTRKKRLPTRASPMRPSFRWTSPSIWQIRRISNPSSV